MEKFLDKIKGATIRAQESMERKHREAAFKKLLANVRKTAKKGLYFYKYIGPYNFSDRLRQLGFSVTPRGYEYDTRDVPNLTIEWCEGNTGKLQASLNAIALQAQERLAKRKEEKEFKKLLANVRKAAKKGKPEYRYFGPYIGLEKLKQLGFTVEPGPVYAFKVSNKEKLEPTLLIRW